MKDEGIIEVKGQEDYAQKVARSTFMNSTEELRSNSRLWEIASKDLMVWIIMNHIKFQPMVWVQWVERNMEEEDEDEGSDDMVTMEVAQADQDAEDLFASTAGESISERVSIFGYYWFLLDESFLGCCA